MDNFSEQEDSFIPFNCYLTERSNEYDKNTEQFGPSLGLHFPISPSNFFGHNDCFNFNFNNHNTFSISRIETNENTDLRNNISSRVLSGRKRKKENENKIEIHTKYSEDNILRKINVHFLNFTILFLNKILHKCNIGDEFCKINSNYKKAINKKNFNSIKNATIADILYEENDKKFKNLYKNRELLNRIKIYNNDILNRIISKSYINIFKEVYYINKKKIFYEGLELNLPGTFGYFLEKVIKGDNEYKQKIEKVIRKNYFPKKFEILN